MKRATDYEELGAISYRRVGEPMTPFERTRLASISPHRTSTSTRMKMGPDTPPRIPPEIPAPPEQPPLPVPTEPLPGPVPTRPTPVPTPPEPLPPNTPEPNQPSQPTGGVEVKGER
jgi:hypothetical protein